MRQGPECYIEFVNVPDAAFADEARRRHDTAFDQVAKE